MLITDINVLSRWFLRYFYKTLDTLVFLVEDFVFAAVLPISSCEENQNVFHFLWKSSLLVTTSADVSAANDSLYPPSDRFRHNSWLFWSFV